MAEESVKVLHILTVRYGPNGLTRCAMNYITHFSPAVRADLAAGFALPDAVKREFEARGAMAVSLPKRLRQPLAYMRALKTLIRREGYAVVQVHGNSCTMALELFAARRGQARVRIPHAHNTHCSAKLLHRLLRPAFERYRTAAFACGKAAGDWLYEGKPFTVVNNAVDTAAFAFDEGARWRIRGALGLDGCFVLGHVGHFNAQKNHGFLVEIFRALHDINPNAALLLIGDGPLRAETEARIRALGLTDAVRIVPATDEVAAYYSAMDAFALPSLFEGLPFTLIEAQANGLGCFVSDAVTREAAMSSLVCYLPAEASAADWAKEIAAANYAPRDESSKAAQGSIAEAGYAIGENAARLETLYEALIEEARP